VVNDSYESGEVVLIAFPFSVSTTRKRRPALILLDTGDEDLIVARITSQPQSSLFDIELKQWQASGLRLQSWVRVHKLATLEKTLVERRLGKLASTDWSEVQRTLKQLWD
jgi:mRNA interferase MazF